MVDTLERPRGPCLHDRQLELAHRAGATADAAGAQRKLSLHALRLKQSATTFAVPQRFLL